MNPTTSINERYFAGLPLRNDPPEKDAGSKTAHSNNVVIRVVLAVAAGIGILWLLMYVVIVRPLRKLNESKPKTGSNGFITYTEEERAEAKKQPEQEEQETTGQEPPEEEEEAPNPTTGGGAPRR